MNEQHITAVPKVHPASREALPDDPLEMQAIEIPGNRDLMLRLLVEEYARVGWGMEAMMQMAADPNYTAFYGLRQSLGEEELRRRVHDIVSRCGVIRIKTTESEPLSEQLVQIELLT
jgi:hypothetical protein